MCEINFAFQTKLRKPELMKLQRFVRSLLFRYQRKSH